MTAVGPCFNRGQCKLNPGANDAHCECANTDTMAANSKLKAMNRFPSKCHYAGEACEVACPMFKGKVCGGHGHRAPMHPAAGRAIKHFQGCLWETANEADLITHYTTDSAPHGGEHGVHTSCGTAKKAMCECDREGGFHGTEEACRVSCPGAGWPSGSYGGGRNVCGGGIKVAPSMALNINGGWLGYKHSRGHCHTSFFLGHQKTVNMKHGLCDCDGRWQGSSPDAGILGRYQVKLYKDTCSISSADNVVNGENPLGYFREDDGCTIDDGSSRKEPLGTAPNCCPFGGELKGSFDQGHGTYWPGGQCLAAAPPKQASLLLGSPAATSAAQQRIVVPLEDKSQPHHALNEL